MIGETAEPFDDGSHIIYVNSTIVDDTPLGRLMHDFRCRRADEMYYDVLSERAGLFKDDEKGVETVGNPLWDEFVRAYHEERSAQERAEEKEKTLLASIKNIMENLKLSAEKAMDALSIPKSEWARYKAML